MNKLWAGLTVSFLAAGVIVTSYYTTENGVRKETIETTAVIVIEEASETERTLCNEIFTETAFTETTAETMCTPEPYKKIEETSTEEYVVSFPLDLNAATQEELAQLPGIGEVIAGNIISYRESVGGFLNRSQLLEVDGIGEGRYCDIYDLVYLDAEYIMEETSPPEENTEVPEETSVTEWVPIIIDVNTATAEDFAYFPTVSPELAENIIQLRYDINGFENIFELLYAEGMTDEIYLSIDEYLVCEAEWTWPYH
ncbi:MAG: helix-hairpin-helix domain-containing protein [Oscillospiraceae bacterium]|nr:helix-hairpin-helix domain-containing protein [Oscillospiraceae bacterium]